VADFLLGPPKLKPDHARGKFGEGMKIASLALLRMECSVHIDTVGRELWIVFLEQKVDGVAEVLAALWRPNGVKVGTRFHIIGYFGSDFSDRFAVNLPREAIWAEAPSPLQEPVKRNNQLLNRAHTVTSRIYARDIYMRDIRSPFSYNLWGFAMAPDRHGPKDESEMWADVGRLWCCVTRVEFLRTFLRMVHFPPVTDSDESYNLNMSDWAMGREPKTGKFYSEFVKDNARAWREAWKMEFGEDAVIRTSDRWDNMVQHLGYTPHSLHFAVKDVLALAITTDKDLIDASAERLREAEVIPDARLTPEQLAHLQLGRAIVREITPLITGRTVRAVHASIIPPASDRVRTAGMYNRATTEIFLDLATLERGHTTVDAVVHELAHHTSQAEDLEDKHSRHMTMIAGEVVRLTHLKTFDEVMKEATW